LTRRSGDTCNVAFGGMVELATEAKRLAQR